MYWIGVIVSEQQAICIVALLAWSLILPLLASTMLRRSENASDRWKTTVWSGQVVMAIAGVVMVLRPGYSFLALACAMALCLVFAMKLHRQVRAD